MMIAIIISTILLILGVTTTNAQTTSLPQNCDVIKNNNCYLHVDEVVNWNQAEAQCVAWGGHLASIHSAGNNLLLNDIRNKVAFTWIGLSDTASNGDYVWTDGTPFDYNNFAPEQPDSLRGESCFHFFNQARGELFWNDYHCSRNSFGQVQTSYICQKKTVNCSATSTSSSVCMELDRVLENTTEGNGGVTYLLMRETILDNILLRINISTGEIIEIMIQRIVLVVGGLEAESGTKLHVGNNAIQMNPNSFEANTVWVVLSENYIETNELTNNSFRIISDVITIQASDPLLGNVTIEFGFTDELKKLDSGNSRIQCSFLTNDGTWSTEGINTVINRNGNGSVECITIHLTTFTLLVSTASNCEKQISEISRLLLQITSYTLLSISLLFLLTSLFIYVVSGKKFFRRDINVMHFNHTVSILLAIFVFIFGAEAFVEHPAVCTIVAFLLHFLWTNVFLSSLGTAVLIFYSIWIVGLKKSRKLSPALIPICWSVSFLWAVIWIIYGKFVAVAYLDSQIEYNRTDKNCRDPCFISTRTNLIWTFLVPILVVLFVNILILILVLIQIRKVLKRKGGMKSELMTFRRVAYGAIVLVPTLSLPFIISLPLAFLRFYHDDELAATIFLWAYVLSTTPIGIVHFFLVTYFIPEARLPKLFCTKYHQKDSTTRTSSVGGFKSTIQNSIENDNTNLKLNIVRPIAKDTSTVV